MAINLERFVKAKRFTEDHVLDDASDQILVKVATDSVAGKVALNAGTSLPGDATNCTDALTACGLNALLADATVGGNAVINGVKALIPLATTTVAGLIEEATGEETRLGATDANRADRAVTPESMSYALQTEKDYKIAITTTSSPYAINGRLELNPADTSATGAGGLFGSYTGNGSLSGVYGITDGTGPAAVGVRGRSISTGGGSNRGVEGNAFGASSGTNIGVYGTAANGATNWAGYFEGKVNATQEIYSAGNTNSIFDGTVGVGHGNPASANRASCTVVGSGAGINSTGAGQTATGQSAGGNNTGDYQTAIGIGSGFQNTGRDQTAVGVNAGINNTGDNQTAIGRNSGYNNTGGNNTFVGASDSGPTIAFNNVSTLGYNTFADASNQVMLGNSSVTSVKTSGTYFGAGFTTTSDETLKENVEAIDPVKALQFRNGLSWKKFELFSESQTEIYDEVSEEIAVLDAEGNPVVDEEGNPVMETVTTKVPTGRYEVKRNSQGIKRGLIAQEVLVLAQSIGDFSDVVVEVGEYFTLDAQGYPVKDAQGNNIVNKRLGIDYDAVSFIVMCAEQSLLIPA